MPQYIVKFRVKGKRNPGRPSKFNVTAPSVGEAWDMAEEEIPATHEVIDVGLKDDTSCKGMGTPTY